MSKGLKIGLIIGIPILILILVIGYNLVNNNLSGATGYVQQYNMDMDDSFGLAVVEESGMALGSAKKSASYNGSKPAPSASPTAADTSVAQDRLIIKTGNMSMVVENVRDAIKKIGEYAIEKGGFIVSSDISKSGLALYGNITLRIPVESFDEGLEEVKSYGEVTSQRVNGQDVTEEFVDLDAQVKNLRATENQFLEIMKKATEIEDILAVQRELSRVRGDIDRIEGRMKYLRKSADLSTLTVHLSTDPDVLPAWDEEDQWKPFAQIKQAFRSLVDVSQGVINFLIWIVIYIPLWLFFSLVIFIVVKIIQRIFRGKKKPDSPNMMQ
ncbi:DUF4349 domain-containing protein [Candidatus Parcubacteria bacterium]|jgi:hypothetical protein|nr:DUF4349 domain-containing protein [Candidatus Parcubacteria bacterium]MBT3948495.1 DUF4349 domain-containing protein [Candidatus Parcubacteria bacterium]